MLLEEHTLANRWRAADGANFTLRVRDEGELGRVWIVLRTEGYGLEPRVWEYRDERAARAFFESVD